MESEKLYFEEYGEKLLKDAGMTKAEFARKLGICKQNVNLVFKTKNIEVLRKVADVLQVPFELLISYPTEPDFTGCTFYSDLVAKGRYIWKSPVRVTPEAQVPLTLESKFRMTPIKS